MNITHHLEILRNHCCHGQDYRYYSVQCRPLLPSISEDREILFQTLVTWFKTPNVESRKLQVIAIRSHGTWSCILAISVHVSGSMADEKAPCKLSRRTTISNLLTPLHLSVPPLHKQFCISSRRPRWPGWLTAPCKPSKPGDHWYQLPSSILQLLHSRQGLTLPYELYPVKYVSRLAKNPQQFSTIRRSWWGLERRRRVKRSDFWFGYTNLPEGRNVITMRSDVLTYMNHRQSQLKTCFYPSNS